MAAELSFGNGFLGRPEQRQQYRVNGLRSWTFGSHDLTLFGVAYYGFSRIPGLIPLFTPVVDDNIDLRQKDLTHTTLAIVTDTWHPSDRQMLTLSAYARTYSLALDSNFGDGLIEQSEFRTVQGSNATYTRRLARRFNLLAGMDYRRDAPRNLDLARAGAEGRWELVTSNNLTISDYGPFAALQADLGHSVKLYAGVRRDEIRFANTDKLTPENSNVQTPGTTSPKVTVTWGREEGSPLPQIAFSYGKAFHANDPRIGSGTDRGALIIQSREYQLIVGKVVAGTEVRVNAGRSDQLGRVGKDRSRYRAAAGCRPIRESLRHRHGAPALFPRLPPGLRYSQANATDHLLHQPLPEAPRLIIDSLATMERLPLGAAAKAEYEYVGEKPLGDGFHAVPVQEIRLNLEKSFGDGRWTLLLNGELADGASGQTLETFALPGEPAPFERIVGVPLRSYGSVSLRYQFQR